MKPTARGLCARRAPTSLGPSPRAREVPPPAHVRAAALPRAVYLPHRGGGPSPGTTTRPRRPGATLPTTSPRRASSARGRGRRPPRSSVPSPWLRRQRSRAANPWSPFRATALLAPATVPPGRPWQRPRSTRSPPRGRAGRRPRPARRLLPRARPSKPRSATWPPSGKRPHRPRTPGTKRRQPRRLAPPPTRLGTGNFGHTVVTIPAPDKGLPSRRRPGGDQGDQGDQGRTGRGGDAGPGPSTAPESLTAALMSAPDTRANAARSLATDCSATSCGRASAPGIRSTTWAAAGLTPASRRHPGISAVGHDPAGSRRPPVRPRGHARPRAGLTTANRAPARRTPLLRGCGGGGRRRSSPPTAQRADGRRRRTDQDGARRGSARRGLGAAPDGHEPGSSSSM